MPSLTLNLLQADCVGSTKVISRVGALGAPLTSESVDAGRHQAFGRQKEAR